MRQHNWTHIGKALWHCEHCNVNLLSDNKPYVKNGKLFSVWNFDDSGDLPTTVSIDCDIALIEKINET